MKRRIIIKDEKITRDMISSRQKGIIKMRSRKSGSHEKARNRSREKMDWLKNQFS